MNPITFSTLACPDWSVETVIAKTSEYGYDGIEWRGGSDGHIPPTISESQIAALQRTSANAGLFAVAVTAYTSFVSNLASERQTSIDELRRYSDFAAELDAPYVRAFLGELPQGTLLDSSLYENISDDLNTAAAYAESVGVKIAIEPHDDFVRSSTIVPILNQVQHAALRVIWDLGNTFAADENPTEGFEILKDRIAYVQVKDGIKDHTTWKLCPLGQGNVPLDQAIRLLLANDYQGAFSVEWEYAWHRELDPPEVALPAALKTVRELLSAAQTESA
ncbi:MAG TPA: sugar phosphate isomerase/epimerase family protein [Anaerolineales bacterium]|nr:sugar phosphate isomerase/epimerase family protein [Anaerolineales bacterium]